MDPPSKGSIVEEPSSLLPLAFSAYVVVVEEVALDLFDLYIPEAGIGEHLPRPLLSAHRAKTHAILLQRGAPRSRASMPAASMVAAGRGRS